MKLDTTHADKICTLFEKTNEWRYLPTLNFVEKNANFLNFEHEIFSNNFLGKLKNWHAFANSDFSSGLVLYQSTDEPAWFITDILGHGDLTEILAEAIKFNEEAGRFKFYITVPKKLIGTIGEHTLNNSAHTYTFFNEGVTPALTKNFYSTYWQVLYKRTMPSVDTVTRCYVLKNDFREKLPMIGSL
jgi:hypothetical protein